MVIVIFLKNIFIVTYKFIILASLPFSFPFLFLYPGLYEFLSVIHSFFCFCCIIVFFPSEKRFLKLKEIFLVHKRLIVLYPKICIFFMIITFIVFIGIYYLFYWCYSFTTQPFVTRGISLFYASCSARMTWLSFLLFASNSYRLTVFLSGSNQIFYQTIVLFSFVDGLSNYFYFVGFYIFIYLRTKKQPPFILSIVAILVTLWWILFFGLPIVFKKLRYFVISYKSIFSYIISLCPVCAKEKTYSAWCQECGTTYFKNNFINWTSENQKIDEIIKETQRNSKVAIDFVEWIPYEQFEKIEKICQGGFGTIYSAFWIQGPLSMLANEFKRTRGIHVALKSGISPEHLKEVIMFFGLSIKIFY